MKARFVTSAANVSQLPHLHLPEFGLIGRSNVGKSSLLGTLLGAPRLVRTSRTPGRTQLLNVFSLADKVVLVDLPGYGYAKLPKTQRASLAKLIGSYITEREALSGLLLLLDARREEVAETDRKIAALALEHNRPLLLVMTKADLVPKNVRLARQRRLEKSFGVPSGYALMVSSKTLLGQDELRERLTELWAPAD